MNQLFKIIGYLEGISFILLLFVGVPLKYLAQDPSWVKTLGMPHGLLFIAYILLAFYIKPNFKWSNKDFALILAASVIPFGTFFVERKYLSKKFQVVKAK